MLLRISKKNKLQKIRNTTKIGQFPYDIHIASFLRELFRAYSTLTSVSQQLVNIFSQIFFILKQNNIALKWCEHEICSAISLRVIASQKTGLFFLSHLIYY